MTDKRYVFIAVLVSVIALYFLVSTLAGRGEAPPHEDAAHRTASNGDLFTVVVSPLTVENRARIITLRGATEAQRMVAVRAETPGVVVRAPVAEGDLVAKGDTLCQLDVDSRQARLDEAQARLRAAELDHEAAIRLQADGFRSETQTAQAKAALDGARAALKQARVDLDKTTIRAPFAGVFDERMAEAGAYLTPGDACGVVVELHPLKVVAFASENEAPLIKAGAPAMIRLAGGVMREGVVSFVAKRADEATRSFRVEAEIGNEDGAAASGLSADMFIEGGSAKGVRAPASSVVLQDDGVIGLRYVDAANIVRFAPVTILEQEDQWLWLAGAPDGARVITRGQEFVTAGQTVEVEERPAELANLRR